MIDIKLLTNSIIHKSNIDIENESRLTIEEKFLIKNINILIDDFKLTRENNKSIDTLVSLLQDTSNKLDQQISDYRFLRLTAQKGLTHINIKELFDSILDTITYETQAQHASIVLFNADCEGGHLKFVKNTIVSSKPVNQLFPMWEEVAEHALKEMKPLYIHNTQEHPVYEHLDMLPFSFMCFPLFYKKEVFGVLNIGHKDTDFFPDESVATIEIIADQISIILKNRYVLDQYSIPVCRLIEKILLAANELIFILDESCRVIYANRYAGEVFSRTGDGKITGRPFLSYFTLDKEKNDFLSRIENLISDENLFNSQGFQFNVGKDESRMIELSVSLIKGKGNNIENIIVCGREK